MPKPLAHYKVLDLSRILAGPFASQLLADFGADVFKIEPPGGDPARFFGPPFEHGDQGETGFFRSANRGKRSLALDLGDAEAWLTVEELLKDADVLVEDFLPDSAERLGYTWERIHERHPKLIVASIRGYASDVPACRRPGYDTVLQAESGWMSLTGEPQGRPMKVGLDLVDVVGALYLANGVQAAILHRERCGEALHVEVPLLEAALAGLAGTAGETLMTGLPPRRMGNVQSHVVPSQTFPCRDGEVALAVGSDRQFEILALWAGIDLVQEPGWTTNEGRVRDRERLVARLEAHFRALGQEEILAFCETHAIPASPVRTVDEVLFRQAGRIHHLIATLYDEGAGCMVPVLASPVLFNEERACAQMPPPRWPG